MSIEQRVFISHFGKNANNITIQGDQGAHKKVEKFESNKEIRQKEIENNLIMQKKKEQISSHQKALAKLKEPMFTLNEYKKLEANLQMMQRFKRKREDILFQNRKSYYKDNFLFRERNSAYVAIPCFLLLFFLLYSALYIVCFYHYFYF